MTILDWFRRIKPAPAALPVGIEVGLALLEIEARAVALNDALIWAHSIGIVSSVDIVVTNVSGAYVMQVQLETARVRSARPSSPPRLVLCQPPQPNGGRDEPTGR